MTKIRIAHLCVGSTDGCETPAMCEECGHDATPERPVLVLTDADGDAFVCVDHAAPLIVPGYNDEQPTSVRFGENPETGEIIASWWDADGNPQKSIEMRWCVKCLADKPVKREYTTSATSDPTAAYELTCGHHTIDL